jgi:hypothetical protein
MRTAAAAIPSPGEMNSLSANQHKKELCNSLLISPRNADDNKM